MEEYSLYGNEIRNIGIRARFSTIPSENPKHLTVLVFSYLDLEALQDNFGDLDFGDLEETQLSLEIRKITFGQAQFLMLEAVFGAEVEDLLKEQISLSFRDM